MDDNNELRRAALAPEDSRGSYTIPDKRFSDRLSCQPIKILNLTNIPNLSSEAIDSKIIEFSTNLNYIIFGTPLKVTFSNQKFFNLVKYLVKTNHGKKLYDTIKASLKLQVAELNKHFEKLESDDLIYLQTLIAEWSKFQTLLVRLSNLLAYLDREFSVLEIGHSTIKELGTEEFRKKLLNKDLVINRLVEATLNCIQLQRENQIPAITNLNGIFGMTKGLRHFRSKLGQGIQTQLQTTYSAQAEKMFKEGTMNLSEHLSYCSSSVESEELGLKFWLDGFNLQSKGFKYIIYQELLHSKLAMDSLKVGLQSTFQKVLTINDEYEEGITLLSKTYHLFYMCEQLHKLFGLVSDALQITSINHFQDRNLDPQLLDRLLAFDLKYQSVVERAFQSNDLAKQVFDKGLRKALQDRGDLLPKLLAKAFDAYLKSPNHVGALENEEDADGEEKRLEAHIQELFRVFRFLQGRDLFEGFYKFFLARRLLLGQINCERLERLVILQLKTVVGQGYTDTLEGMFLDIERSAELVQKFQNWQTKQLLPSPSADFNMVVPAPFQFEPKVLTTKNWPNYPIEPFKLPDQMQRVVDNFNHMYLETYRERKLFWHHPQSKCTLKATFLNRSYELTVSLSQALVLLQFQDDLTNISGGSFKGAVESKRIKLSYDQLLQRTHLSSTQLKLVLVSLIRPRNFLLKTPSVEVAHRVTETDLFEVNANFKNNKSKIYVNSIQLKETKNEDDALHHSVLENRKFLVEAFLVRTLKAVKSATTHHLIKEAIQQLNFPVDPKTIKERISNLMEREFLVRDEVDLEKVHYIA